MAKHGTPLINIDWLLELREIGPTLSPAQPIWVGHTICESPTLPPPHSHPYCEVNLLVRGVIDQIVAHDNTPRIPGDLFIAGPGFPHWGKVIEHPLEYITVFFDPGILLEQRGTDEGFEILHRFMAPQSLRQRLAHPTEEEGDSIRNAFHQMTAEFEGRAFGYQIKLGALLASLLVDLLRWEKKSGTSISPSENDVEWKGIVRVLNYLQTHYDQPIYARDLTAISGMTLTRMEASFRHSLGMPWVKYLQAYRIRRAAALLSQGSNNVSETAAAVGFQSLSHFNATFRSFMQVSPSQFQKRASLTGEKQQK